MVQFLMDNGVALLVALLALEQSLGVLVKLFPGLSGFGSILASVITITQKILSFLKPSS